MVLAVLNKLEIHISYCMDKLRQFVVVLFMHPDSMKMLKMLDVQPGLIINKFLKMFSDHRIYFNTSL